MGLNMKKIRNILITGGAGFIGSHLADKLIENNYNVRILDNLEPQVHGSAQKTPKYLPQKIEFLRGDIRKTDDIEHAVENIDAIYHFAANVGIGQSMYQINKYISTNTGGTAKLFDHLINSENTVKKVIIASSMSIYGEGKYRCENCGIVFPQHRDAESLKAKQWDPTCSTCGAILQPLPTDESTPLGPTSIYAQSKRHQEEIALLLGKTYGLPTVALRFFNTYGARQALSNPYTGVCAIFSSRIKNNNPPVIYEDGLQSRDFIHISDLITANIIALEKNSANYEIFNVGSGSRSTILEIAQLLIQLMQSRLNAKITNTYRKGDIRHSFADITKIQRKLGFQPKIKLQDGLTELVQWIKTQADIVDDFHKAESELITRGLTKK